MVKKLEKIENLCESIEYKTQLIGRDMRLVNSVSSMKWLGIFIGFILTIIFVALPIIYYKGGF